MLRVHRGTVGRRRSYQQSTYCRRPSFRRAQMPRRHFTPSFGNGRRRRTARRDTQMKLLKRLSVLILAAAASFLHSGARVAAQDDLPKRHFDVALDFMRQQRYTEALRDFDLVVSSYPNSPVADDALLEIATYHLDIAEDATA